MQQRLEVSRLCTRKLDSHDRSIDQEQGIDCTAEEGIFFVVVFNCLDVLLREWSVTMTVIGGSYTVMPLGKTNRSLGKANQLATRLNSELANAPTACENQPNQLTTRPTNR